MIKNIFFFISCVLLFFSCDHHILDKPFYPVSYEADFQELARTPNVNQEDLFFLNYSITRHRDYFDYEIKGVSYLELIKQARELKEDGIGVIQKFDDVTMPEGLETEITDIKMAVLPRKNRPSRKVKNLKFSCSFINTTTEDIAINYATFIINGPFGHHLMTAGYETNCKIPARSTQRVHFVMEAKKIRTNLFFEKSNDIKRLMFDDLFDKFKVEVGGIQTDPDPSNYSSCFSNIGVIEPFEYSKYRDLFPDGIKAEEIDGKPTIHFGTKLYTREEDGEVLQYK